MKLRILWLVLGTRYMAFRNHFRSKVYEDFCCYDVCEQRCTLCHIYTRLQATIYDFTYILTSDRVITNLDVLRDPKNMGISVGILVLSCIQDTLCHINFRLMAAIFDCLFISRSDRVLLSSAMLHDPKTWV